MASPDDQSPVHALLVALAAMLAVALLVGLAVAGGVLGFVRSAGVGETSDVEATDAAESLFVPRYRPTDEPESGGVSEPSRSPTREPRESRTPRGPRISLTMSPTSVAPGERINLSGDYRAPDGRTLQIQRRENGSWVDFPVTATVSGGSFETWILTSRTGRSPFRMVDEEAGRRSNTVVVQVG